MDIDEATTEAILDRGDRLLAESARVLRDVEATLRSVSTGPTTDPAA